MLCVVGVVGQALVGPKAPSVGATLTPAGHVRWRRGQDTVLTNGRAVTGVTAYTFVTEPYGGMRGAGRTTVLVMVGVGWELRLVLRDSVGTVICGSNWACTESHLGQHLSACQG